MTTTTRPKTKRRGYSEGSIYQRGDGRWVGAISFGYDPNGKRQRRTVYGKTKKDVQGKLAKLQNQKLDDTLSKPSKLTVAKFLNQWLEDVVRTTTRIATYHNYEIMVRKHISPRIGGIVLEKLRPSHVQHLLSEMDRAGASLRLRKLVRTVLRRALQQAVKWGMVTRNVCDAVEAPKVPKPEHRTLNAEETKRFLENAREDRLYAIFVFAIATGLREGELFGLQWSDIDLEARVLHVRRKVLEVNGKFVIEEPKTAKGRRCVDLPPIAIDAYHEHRKRMLAEGFAGGEWVFCDTKGGLLRRSNFLRERFRPILKAAELPQIRFHDLRHTSATLLLLQGVHPKVVQERLGHSTISMTLDTYSHVLPGMQKEAAEKLNDVLTA